MANSFIEEIGNLLFCHEVSNFLMKSSCVYAWWRKEMIKYDYDLFWIENFFPDLIKPFNGQGCRRVVSHYNVNVSDHNVS